MTAAAANRLTLRALEERDAENIFLLNNDPEVLKYVHDEPFRDVGAARNWIADIARQLPHGIGRWAIETVDGTWVGRCSLRRLSDGTVLMGYRLLREHWRRGYASEAVRLMLDQAFSVHELPFVASKVARENIASQRVVAKNGGVFWKEDACGHFSDALVYRFSNPSVTG
ncbi:MAG: GNAT family N-acetyltransferase [Flavobacteriales bacterium]|nr:MAG: GNAT family N-acetyltransferase [Flavobacteriales bacterium]